MKEEHVEIEKCLKDKGLDYSYYKNVANHIKNTLDNDNPIDLPRFEEDLEKMIQMVSVCGNSYTKRKYTRLREILVQDRYITDKEAEKRIDDINTILRNLYKEDESIEHRTARELPQGEALRVLRIIDSKLDD